METIRNYLNTMFAGLPDTPEVRKAYIELGAMMEDKYTELIDEGLSENEAVGTVISEFGNLEELAPSQRIAPPSLPPPMKEAERPARRTELMRAARIREPERLERRTERMREPVRPVRLVHRAALMRKPERRMTGAGLSHRKSCATI